MRSIARLGWVVPAVGVLMFVSACSSSDSTTPTSSSSTTTTVTTTSVASAPVVPPPAAPATPTANAPANTQTQGVAPTGRSDDPGGSPCTDQNGAPGHYIYSDSSQQWVCEVTGDAPQANTQAPQQPRSDGDPGGTPCEDQSGMKGRYIWSDSSNMWVCQIS